MGYLIIGALATPITAYLLLISLTGIRISKRVSRYYSKGGFMPDIGIIFCGNRAVVTERRRNEESPRHHTEVAYGPFFWLRIAFAVARVFRKCTAIK